MEDSGGALADEEEGVVEVSPLVSYAGEGLAPLTEGKTFEEAYVLELQVRQAAWRGRAARGNDTAAGRCSAVTAGDAHQEGWPQVRDRVCEERRAGNTGRHSFCYCH